MKMESHQPNNQQPRPWTKHSRGIKTYKKILFSPVAANWTVNSITVHPSLEALVILFIIIIFFVDFPYFPRKQLFSI